MKFQKTIVSYLVSFLLINILIAQDSVLYVDKNTSINKNYLEENFQKTFFIELKNPSKLDLNSIPIIINVSEILDKYPDFNISNYILFEETEKEKYEIISSQIDDLNDNGYPDELVFIISLNKLESKQIGCAYSFNGKINVNYISKAGTNRDWTKRKWAIGWESNLAGYSFFHGKIDFYAKRLEGLQLQNFKKPGFNYHKLNDWGMDVLEIYKSSGLGGLTIWENDSAITTIKNYDEQQIVYKRNIISSGPVRSLVEVDIENIVSGSTKYLVNLRMSTFADNFYSVYEISVNNDLIDSVIVSPGFEKLINDEWFLDKKVGFFTSWGEMNEQIGEIGLGFIFPSKKYVGFTQNNLDRFMKFCVATNMKEKFYLIGGWQKGIYPNSINNLDEWNTFVKDIIEKINIPIKINIQSNNL